MFRLDCGPHFPYPDLHQKWVIDGYAVRTKPQAPRTLGCAILGVYGPGECASSAIVVSR
jgi:hypothetical protein